jgi:hypothetical protein
MMTGKEKLQKAFAHESAPLLMDIGGMPTTGAHSSVVEKLRDYYGLEKHPVTILEPMQMLGLIEDDLKQALGVQTTPLGGDYNMFGIKQENFKEFRTPWGQTVLVPGEFHTDVSEKGDVLLYAKGDRSHPAAARMAASAYFFDATERAGEFDEDEYRVEDNFEEFGPVEESTLEHFRAMKALYQGSDDAMLGNLGGTGFGDIALVPGVGLTQPKGIRGVEEWYVSTLLRPDKLRQIFDYQLEWALKNLEKMAAILGDTIQVAYVCGTDFGTQKAPFCSCELFDELYAPYYRAVNGWIHAHTNWKTFKHSCGSIRPLMSRLIDTGFDCINPVQWTAGDMDRETLKREYGKHVIFWGGGIDTQRTLPYGTPKEVYDQALECCRIFGKGGGYVFNTIHNIQANTPIENIIAMVNAVRDYNGER